MMQNFSKIRFEENRLIYNGDKPKKGWAREALAPIAKGAGELLTAAAELVGLATTTTTDALNFLKGGFGDTKEFMKKMIEKTKDKIVGTPIDLPEFGEFKDSGLFLLPEREDEQGPNAPEDVNEFNDHASKLAILSIRKQRLTRFYKYAIDDFAKIEGKLNSINAIKSKTEDEIFIVRGKINKLEAFLSRNKLSKDDPRRIEIESILAELKSHLHILEESINKVIKWEIPALTKEVLGSYKQRFQFLPPEEGTLIDLEALYRYLEIYTVEYATKMTLYNDEIEKHEYYMYKIYDTLSPRDEATADVRFKKIGAKMKEIINKEKKNSYDKPVAELDLLKHLQSKSRKTSPSAGKNNFKDVFDLDF